MKSFLELHEFPTLVAALATVKEAAALANYDMTAPRLAE
jgi:aspartate ammonia-lyase